MRTLLVPETDVGHGSAHLRRAIRLLGALPNSSILLPRDRSRISGLIEGIAEDRIVCEIEGPWDRIVVDRFSVSEREMQGILAAGCTIGIDLGGDGRPLCDYLIDTLPRLDRSLSNETDEAFLALPDRSAEDAGDLDRDRARTSSILVTFGGEDPAHLSEAVALLLSRAGYGGATTIVRPAMRELGPVPPEITVLPPQPSITAFIAEAGVVITAFGMTAYEARALAAPVVTVAPSRYHDRLARAAGFARAGVRAPRRRRLVRLLRADRRVMTGGPRARRELGDRIAHLELPVHRGCPVHHVYGRALWRNEEKTYFVCPRCGLVYLERFAADDETYGPEYFMEEYRAQYGRTYLEDFEHIYAMGTQRLSRAMKVAQARPRSVLDIGCAYGPFLAAARDRGLSAYGLDVAENAVEYVRTELGIPAARESILDFVPSDSFDRSEFDLVTLWYVIEHFARLDLLLPKLATLVRPGGVLAFSTPYGAGVSARRNASGFYEASPRDHYSVWNKSSTRRILGEFGFTVRRFKVTGHHPERYPAVRRGIVPHRLAGLHSSVFGRGDTFEVYATKER